MKQYHYKLDKYRSRDNRYICPNCGKTRCFTRYVCIETGNYVHDSVGRCDHEASCGYHYTPSQFYHDNPWESRDTESHSQYRSTWSSDKKPAPPPPPTYLPDSFVTDRLSTASPFAQWLIRTVGIGPATDASNRFRLGITSPGKYKSPSVIFWQIDKYGNVHDGKLMWYRPDGHREKWMTWVSSKLKDAGLYPDQDTQKCLFGEHQLIGDSVNYELQQKVICLVESEKSAIVCSCLFPRFIWMATCGCGGLNSAKLRPIRGHHVIVFPDAGSADHWYEILDTSGLDYEMFPIEHYQPNTDLVDILIDHVKPISGSQVNIKQYLSTH